MTASSIPEVGRLGVLDGSLRVGAVGWAAPLERAGIGCFWIPDAAPDLAAVAGLASVTDEGVIGTAIVSIWACTPAELAAATARAEACAPGRFLLGLGVSHAPIVERAGKTYDRPVARLRAFLDELDTLAPGLTARCALGVNGPRMLTLARERTAGAVPYLVTPEHTFSARGLLGPGVLLAPEQKVVLDDDPVRSRTLCRQRLAVYLTLPNYVGNLFRLGFTDDDVADGGSDRLVDALVVWGDAERIADRVRAHWDAGADHVALHVLGQRGADPTSVVLAVIAALGGASAVKP